VESSLLHAVSSRAVGSGVIPERWRRATSYPRGANTWLDLPEPEDASDEKLISDVRAHGWHCLHVANEHHPAHAAQDEALGRHVIYDAAFSCTVGLRLTHSHPELVLVGRGKQGHAIISSAVTAIEQGARFTGRRRQRSSPEGLRRLVRSRQHVTTH
jgi:hypothetical protein